MPAYEFYCEQCGVFEKQMPMQEASSSVECPTCGLVANRLFTAISVWTTYGAVREKMKQGELPKRMTREEWRAHAPRRHPYHGPARPWQLGH